MDRSFDFWFVDIPGSTSVMGDAGGGWGNNPYWPRVSYCHGNPPDIGFDMVGCRCAE